MHESNTLTAEPEWKQEFNKFEAFLQRFKINIDTIVDRSYVERQIENSDQRVQYSTRAHVIFTERKHIRDNKPWHHGFDRKRVNKEFRDLPQLIIAQDIKDALVQKSGESVFKNFESHIAHLLDFANHDFTAHALGIDLHSEVPRAMEQVIVFDANPLVDGDPSERMAAMSHRILFEKACSQAPSLKKLVLRETREALRAIENLDEKHKKELVSAIRYLLYCVIRPDDSDVEPLRARFAGQNVFPATAWSNAVHQKNFKVEGSDASISDEELFKILYSHPVCSPDITDEMGKEKKIELNEKYRERIIAQIKSVAK